MQLVQAFLTIGQTERRGLDRFLATRATLARALAAVAGVPLCMLRPLEAAGDRESLVLAAGDPTGDPVGAPHRLDSLHRALER
ncbi:MAG: hypothetical protein AAGC55_19545, partial [Myxococcota bacterium]